MLLLPTLSDHHLGGDEVRQTQLPNLLGRFRGEPGEPWQGRFFDRALRTVKGYAETAEYIHMNPVRRGLVRQPGEWRWSSYHEYAGVSAAEQQQRCGLVIDRVRLPADENARI